MTLLATYLPYILGVLGGALICLPLGRIIGEERERKRTAAMVAEMLRESRERDWKIAVLTSQVETLRAKRLRGGMA